MKMSCYIYKDGRQIRPAGASKKQPISTSSPANTNSLFKPFSKTTSNATESTSIVITKPDDTNNTPARVGAKTPVTSQVKPDSVERQVSSDSRGGAAVSQSGVGAGGEVRLSPGASPSNSQHDMFLSPSGSMSGSSGSNQSSQIVELPPLGADPETVSVQYINT